VRIKDLRYIANRIISAKFFFGTYLAEHEIFLLKNFSVRRQSRLPSFRSICTSTNLVCDFIVNKNFMNDFNKNKNLPYNPPVQPTEAKSETSTYIVIAIIAFALGLGSGWLWTKKNIAPVEGTKNVKTTEVTDKMTGQTPNGDLTISNSILVKDQTAGIEVAVEQVVLTNMAWVVVREDDGAGAPGKILGAQLFEAGVGVGNVELLRGTEAGGTYYAMIYSDNGDHAFDPKLDTPLIDSFGAPIMATFEAN